MRWGRELITRFIWGGGFGERLGGNERLAPEFSFLGDVTIGFVVARGRSGTIHHHLSLFFLPHPP